MNKPNKSIIAMRKAGLVKATAFTEEQKQIAERYLDMAEGYCDNRQEASSAMLTRSRDLGLKGIRIGQEASYANAR